MFIASAELETETGNRYKYKIVTEKSKEDYDSEPAIVFYEADIADKIIEAYTNEKEYFQYEKQKFKIVSFVSNSSFSKYNKHKFRKIDISEKPIPIHLYKKTAICPKCKANKKENNLENVIATISCLLNRSDTCNVEIQYCHNCKRYFVDEQSLAEYEKRYGLLLFERMKSSDDSGWFEGSDYSFDSDTILSRYGYSAQTDKVSEKSRRAILTYLIENGYKNEIKSILSYFIRVRGDRCYKACPIWKSDLYFVNNYNSNNDRYIGYGKIDY